MGKTYCLSQVQTVALDEKAGEATSTLNPCSEVDTVHVPTMLLADLFV